MTAAAAARPEPVRNAALSAAGLTTLVGLVLTILVVTRVLTPGDSAVLGPALASAIPTVVGAVSTVVAAFHARQRVTPLAAPLNAAGEQLLTAAQAAVAAGLTGPAQQPGVADHAAGGPRSEAARQAALNQPDQQPPAPPATG